MGKEVAECSEVECSNVMLEYTNFIHVLPPKSILQRNIRCFCDEYFVIHPLYIRFDSVHFWFFSFFVSRTTFFALSIQTKAQSHVWKFVFIWNLISSPLAHLLWLCALTCKKVADESSFAPQLHSEGSEKKDENAIMFSLTCSQTWPRLGRLNVFLSLRARFRKRVWTNSRFCPDFTRRIEHQFLKKSLDKICIYYWTCPVFSQYPVHYSSGLQCISCP